MEPKDYSLIYMEIRKRETEIYEDPGLEGLAINVFGRDLIEEANRNQTGQ